MQKTMPDSKAIKWLNDMDITRQNNEIFLKGRHFFKGEDSYNETEYEYAAIK